MPNKKCQFCGEEIQDKAIKCKHCHEIVGDGPFANVRRNQFSVALTTFIALATGGVGYCAKLITDEEIHFSCWASFWFFIAAAGFGAGLFAGVFTTLTRLRDLRLSVKRDYKERDTVEYKLLDDKAESWGRVSWGLLKTLIVCVSIGIISIACCIAIMYGGKLFCGQIDGQTTNTVQIPPAVPPS